MRALGGSRTCWNAGILCRIGLIFGVADSNGTGDAGGVDEFLACCDHNSLHVHSHRGGNRDHFQFSSNDILYVKFMILGFSDTKNKKQNNGYF
jgi:hypothetical protein